MNLNELTPLVLKPLEKISPSNYYSLQSCELKGILNENHHAPLTPTHPAARMGQIMHKLLQMTVLGQISDEKVMQSAWENTCREVEQEMSESALEKHLVPLEASANSFETKKKLLFTMIRKLWKKHSENVKGAKVRLETETWYKTDDGKVVGRLDLVRYTDFGAEIVDYKTDPVVNQNSEDIVLRPEYQNQLKLYAALFYSVKKEWPRKLVLAGIDQKEYDVKFDQDECIQMLNSAKAYIDRINKQIEAGADSEKFAKPSPESCRYCPFRPACRAYWKDRGEGKGWPVDVIGEVKENKLLGNGLRRIVVANNQKNVAVRGLSTDRHNFLDRNVKRAIFCDLSPDQTEGSYFENMLTVGYPNDDGVV